MKFLKKWGALILSIVFILAIAILIILSSKSISEYKQAVNERDSQIATLEQSLNEIGVCSVGYVLNTDVRAGETVSTDYFTRVSVPEKLGLGIITDTTPLEGAYFRTSLQEGTVLTTEDINYTEVMDSQRYYDIMIDQMPIGVEAGDYVDIRILFPYGEDMIALTCKKIEEINNGVAKFIFSEEEIVVYNSMLLDKIIYQGTTIYATEYVDAGSQYAAEAFYPVNKSQQDLLVDNPNALVLIKEEMKLKRQATEEMLGGGLSDQTENDLNRIDSQISSIRTQLSSRVESANNVISARREQEAREAAAKAAQEAAGY